jgi:hypothetical protein
MIRSLFAVIGGYIAMAVGIGITTFVVSRFFPGITVNGQPTPQYILINLAYSAVFGVLGGYVAAATAGREPLKHAIILAAVCYLFFLMAMSAPSPPDMPPWPFWYRIGLLIILGPSVTFGGFLRQRQQPPPSM